MHPPLIRHLTSKLACYSKSDDGLLGSPMYTLYIILCTWIQYTWYYVYVYIIRIFWKQSSVGSFSIKIFEHCLLIIPTTNLGSYNQTILTPVSSFTAQQTHSSPAYTWSQYVSHRDLLKIALPFTNIKTAVLDLFVSSAFLDYDKFVWRRYYNRNILANWKGSNF